MPIANQLDVEAEDERSSLNSEEPIVSSDSVKEPIVGGRPNARMARDEVLDSMSGDDQAETIRRAERVGPEKDDPDWLIALAALRVEKAVNLAVKRLEEVATTMTTTGELGTRVRQGRSLFDQCLDLCSSIAEREKLKSLAIRLHLSEDAPSWMIVLLHAEARAIFGLRSAAQPDPRPSWRVKLARFISDQ